MRFFSPIFPIFYPIFDVIKSELFQPLRDFTKSFLPKNAVKNALKQQDFINEALNSERNNFYFLI